MKRRTFLRNTALLSSTLLLPSFKFAVSASPKVLILGGGIAGLGAAYQLAQQGISFEVLEARNRLGGRILSHKFAQPSEMTAELGAEWIGASHENLLNLCKTFDLPLVEHRFPTDLILQKQHTPYQNWSYSKDWQQTFQQIIANYQNMNAQDLQRLDKTNWWRFLKQKGITDQELEIRELFDDTDFGENIRYVSAYSALAEYAESSPANEMDFRIQGGNNKIIEALANAIGKEHLHTDKVVTKIIQNGKNVTVICQDGSQWEAQKVICTLPTFALSQVEFSPTLPPTYMEALASLQYARIIKTSVLFKERFWQRPDFSVMTDSPAHFIFHSTQNQDSPQGVLTSYATGDKAYLMHKLSSQEKIQTIAEALKPAFGDVLPLAERTLGYYWGADVYSYGAYALYTPTQLFSVGKILAEPFKNILFAGEHLADWQGFMEGALTSGMEAAMKV